MASRDTAKYWQDRALASRVATDKLEQSSFSRLNVLLTKHNKEIDNQIKGFDVKYAKENLSAAETKKIKEQLKKTSDYYTRDTYLKKLYDEKAPLYRLNRLEGLQASIQEQLTLMTASQELDLSKTLYSVADSAYELQHKAFSDGLSGVKFNALSTKQLDYIVNTTWVGKSNWSARIWKDRDLLGQSLDVVLKDGVVRGYSVEKITKQIKDKFGTSRYQAMRLVRTESTHVHGQADLLAYDEFETKKYEYLAHLDDRTSEICTSLNRKTFDVKKAEVGKNYPPMHVNCRSTTAPIVDWDYLDQKYS